MSIKLIFFVASMIYLVNRHRNLFLLTMNLLQMFIALSCAIAIGTNLSQFICIGRFTAVSFQVLGHMKTVLVLTLGFVLFGKEGLNLHVIMGMIFAVAGMIWYGHASSQPGGKERSQPPSNINNKPEEEIGLVKSENV